MGHATARGPVRVYNNSTITGLATRAASEFRADGWQVGQVANYSAGVIPTSTVYYRPGTAEHRRPQQTGALRSTPPDGGSRPPGVTVAPNP